jgi:hypothetical protein
MGQMIGAPAGAGKVSYLGANPRRSEDSVAPRQMIDKGEARHYVIDLLNVSRSALG